MSALGGYYDFIQLPDVDSTTGIVAIAIGHFPADLRLVVRETFAGTLPARADLLYRACDSKPPIELGEQHPHLVVIHTDGQSHVLAGYVRVHELTPRGYAVPVTHDNRRVPLLREPLPVRRLAFRSGGWKEGVAVDDAIELYRKLYFAAYTQPARTT